MIITLLHAKYPHKDRIKKAVKVIMDRQLADGSWAQEQIEGIFNRYVSTTSHQRAEETHADNRLFPLCSAISPVDVGCGLMLQKL